MERVKISVCIPTYNNATTILDTLNSVLMQTYQDYEILIGDDNSTDETLKVVYCIDDKRIRIYKNQKNIGCGNNLTKLYLNAKGEIIFYLCGDDVLTKDTVLADVYWRFSIYPLLKVLGRKYYWFIDNPSKPIRVKPSSDLLEQSDQISGIAFRREAMSGNFWNEPFVEMASMVKRVSDITPSGGDVMMEFTVAVRIMNNGSTNPKVYKESPLLNWYKIVGPRKFVVKNFIGLVQIKNYGSFYALIREIWYLIILCPLNLGDPRFWFFSLLTLFTPRFLLRRLSEFWKLRLNRRTFKWPEY